MGSEATPGGDEVALKDACSQCRFWEQLGPERSSILDIASGALKKMGLGECRRHPPVLDVQARKEWRKRNKDELDTVDGIFMCCFFPVTRDGEWCGEFQPCEDGVPRIDNPEVGRGGGQGPGG